MHALCAFLEHEDYSIWLHPVKRYVTPFEDARNPSTMRLA